ncbi:unnamed protein product [Rangifer tarandus platyrhynchus]|uniref:Uncharacterized protein n=2 Tax=Rangifer tarandus platyrhynchus TaxID=3082113 RepID=A0ABN8YLE4_RANTA|nr:unnamed protein product [Rangifer tarandus platyrhynchus]
MGPVAMGFQQDWLCGQLSILRQRLTGTSGMVGHQVARMVGPWLPGIPLGTQSVPALVTDPSPVRDARRYLGLGWLGLMAAHGCWGRHQEVGVCSPRAAVMSALLRPPLAVLPRLCALPAGLSAVS